MAVLINGNGYSPVTAQQDADLYAGIVGNDLVVLDVGNKMELQQISNTTLRILDGEAISQGRRLHIDVGSYDEFTIPSGSQGIMSYYAIGYHIYTDGSGNEVAETFVQEVESDTAKPTENQLRDGATETYITLYTITVDSLTIEGFIEHFHGPIVLKTNESFQCGQYTSTTNIPAGSYADFTLNFIYEFPETPTVVACAYSTSTAAGMGNVLVAVTEERPTYFKMRIFNNDSSARSPYVNWIALV